MRLSTGTYSRRVAPCTVFGRRGRRLSVRSSLRVRSGASTRHGCPMFAGASAFLCVTTMRGRTRKRVRVSCLRLNEKDGVVDNTRPVSCRRVACRAGRPARAMRLPHVPLGASTARAARPASWLGPTAAHRRRTGRRPSGQRSPPVLRPTAGEPSRDPASTDDHAGSTCHAPLQRRSQKAFGRPQSSFLRIGGVVIARLKSTGRPRSGKGSGGNRHRAYRCG